MHCDRGRAVQVCPHGQTSNDDNTNDETTSSLPVKLHGVPFAIRLTSGISRSAQVTSAPSAACHVRAQDTWRLNRTHPSRSDNKHDSTV